MASPFNQRKEKDNKVSPREGLGKRLLSDGVYRGADQIPWEVRASPNSLPQSRSGGEG